MSRTRIKLCGMTRAEDVALAVELGVDYIGLIVAGGSPRRLDIEQAAALRAAVPATTAVVVLCRDNPEDEVAAVVAQLRPDVLQFHGREDAVFCAAFGLPYWKAIAMGDGRDPVPAMARHPSAQAFVLDGHGEGEAGGSGRRFDWSRLPAQSIQPILLAGGLRPDNVAEALRIARPWGVDVASGIESAPGIKDPEAMRRFVVAVRAADADPQGAVIG